MQKESGQQSKEEKNGKFDDVSQNYQGEEDIQKMFFKAQEQDGNYFDSTDSHEGQAGFSSFYETQMGQLYDKKKQST